MRRAWRVVVTERAMSGQWRNFATTAMSYTEARREVGAHEAMGRKARIVPREDCEPGPLPTQAATEGVAR